MEESILFKFIKMGSLVFGLTSVDTRSFILVGLVWSACDFNG